MNINSKSKNDLNNNNIDQLTKNFHLKPLNLTDLFKNGELNEKLADNFFECLLCNQSFDVVSNKKLYLAHLLEIHRLVIANVDQIGDFKKYVNYWNERLKQIKLEDICFLINTNTDSNDKAQIETFYLLSDDLPEDRQLREKLNIFKLDLEFVIIKEKAIKQQEIERNDQNYFRNCLFCSTLIGNNRSNLLSHMLIEHNFSIGNADNLVYFDEFYQKLKERFDSFQCLYCHKVFNDKQTFKEHMRKKQHKCISSQNKEFDRFYIINYLEYSKVWSDIKSEKDIDEMDDTSEAHKSLEDWNDPIQDYFCLFCDNSFDNESDILNHMNTIHKYDFKTNILMNNLSFYEQVKLINYIRRQLLMNSCFICKENFSSKQDLIEHLNLNEHIKEFPIKDYWNQPEYLFSTFEDDTLLCLLNDDAYNQDENKIKVIPERFDVEMRYELCNNLHDLNI